MHCKKKKPTKCFVRVLACNFLAGRHSCTDPIHWSNGAEGKAGFLSFFLLLLLLNNAYLCLSLVKSYWLSLTVFIVKHIFLLLISALSFVNCKALCAVCRCKPNTSWLLTDQVHPVLYQKKNNLTNKTDLSMMYTLYEWSKKQETVVISLNACSL